MGRAFSRPEVVDENGEFRIVRVADPDDEFATRQYLTLVTWANDYPNQRFGWEDESIVIPWASPNMHTAHAVLGAYEQGIEDAESASIVRGPYSY